MSSNRQEFEDDFFRRLRNSTPQQQWQIGQELNPYAEPQLTQAEMTRFRMLMEHIAFEALKKVLPRTSELQGAHWARHIESFCYEAFDHAVRNACSTLLKAKAVKANIKEAKTKANDVVHQAKIAMRTERSRLIKDTRNELARNLQTARGKLRKLAMQIVAHERKVALYGDLYKTRQAMAGQLERARKRLFEIRRRRVVEEAQIMRANGGVLPNHVNSTLYPSPPLPELPASLLGEGLPEEPGIYFLWRNGIIEYVGKSIKLNQRVVLKTHHVLREHHTISYVVLDERDLTWAECWYIGCLRPQLNFGRLASHYDPDYKETSS